MSALIHTTTVIPAKAGIQSGRSVYLIKTELLPATTAGKLRGRKGSMAETLKTTDSEKLMTEHLDVLRGYAKRVVAHGGVLTTRRRARQDHANDRVHGAGAKCRHQRLRSLFADLRRYGAARRVEVRLPDLPQACRSRAQRSLRRRDGFQRHLTFNRPSAGYAIGLVLTGPRRHGDDQEPQRIVPRRPELEVSANGYRETHALSHVYHPFFVAEPTPHLSRTLQEVPDLLHCPVRDGQGHFSRDSGCSAPCSRDSSMTAAVSQSRPARGYRSRWRVGCSPILG